MIELLIVVAIIAILALIAVPNFLEAQIRAKVSRSKADQRSLHLGVEALRVDRNVLLIDFWDDDKGQVAMDRLHDVLMMPYQANNNRGGTAGVLAPLTTPIAYITSLPDDVFATDELGSSYIAGNPPLIAADRVRPFTYMYFDDDPEFSGHDHGMKFYRKDTQDWRQVGSRPLQEGEFATFGLGPGRSGSYTEAGIPYDPTNGSVSVGEIVRHSADPR